MKKIIYMVFSFLMLFTLFACGKNDIEKEDESKIEKYEVIFHYKDDEGNSKQTIINYKKNDKLNAPTGNFGKRKGYDLAYWEYEGERYEFGFQVNQKIELHAKYNIKKYSVLTNVNGKQEQYQVEHNKRLSIPEPFYENHTFQGWIDEDGNEYDLNKPFQKPTILTAKFAPEKLNLKFFWGEYNYNGYDQTPIYKEVVAEYGKKLDRDAFIFDGKDYSIGSPDPHGNSRIVSDYVNKETGEVYDLEKGVRHNNLILEPKYSTIYRSYEIIYPDGETIKKTVVHNARVEFKADDFKYYDNKYFQGAYLSDGTQASNEGQLNRYLIDRDNIKFYIKYQDGHPDSILDVEHIYNTDNYFFRGIKDKKYRGRITVPEIYKNPYDNKEYPIKQISSTAFASNTNITHVTIKTKITEIPDFAFYNCHNLEELDIDYSLIEKIGQFAFKNCYNLKKFKLENTKIKNVEFSSFENCYSLNEIIMPNETVKIEDNAFKNCKNLESIFLKNVKEIGNNAFYNLEKISSINFSEKLEEIGSKAFSNCKNLHSVNLPSKLRSIGSEAFSNCEKLEDLNIPESIEYLGERFVSKNNTIKKLYLKNISFLGSNVFENFTKLEEVEFENFNSVKKDTFKNCPNLTKLTVKNYLTEKKVDLSEYKNLEFEITNSLPETIDISVEKLVIKDSAKISKNLTQLNITGNSIIKNLILPEYLTGLNNANGVKEITVGNNLTETLLFHNNNSLEKINFKDDNPYFKEYKGVIYYNYKKQTKWYIIKVVDDNLKELEFLPNKEINYGNSNNLKNHLEKIEKVVLTHTYYDPSLFSMFTNAKEVSIKPETPEPRSYKLIDGMLYTGDEKYVFFLPPKMDIETFKIKSEQINQQFLQNLNIKKFELEGVNPIFEIVNNMLIQKEYYSPDNRYLARYFDNDKLEDTISPSLNIRKVFKDAFSSKHLKLKKITFEIPDLYFENVLFGQSIEEIVINEKTNGYLNDIESEKPIKMVFGGNSTTISLIAKIKRPLTVTVTDKVKTITRYAFEDNNLSEFDFSNIEEVGQSAFKGTKLRKVEFSLKLKKVDYHAFDNCSMLEEIINLAAVSSNTIDNCPNLKILKLRKTSYISLGKSYDLEKIEVDEEFRQFYGSDGDKKSFSKIEELKVYKKTSVSNFSILFPNLKKLDIDSEQFNYDIYGKFDELEEVNIGPNATYSSTDRYNFFMHTPKLKKITVDSANNNFKVVDDALYSFDMKRLFKYFGSPKNEYTIAESVEGLFNGWYITGDNSLKKLIVKNRINFYEVEFPKSVEELEFHEINGISLLRSKRIFPNLRKVVIGDNVKGEELANNIGGVFTDNENSKFIEFSILESNNYIKKIGGAIYSKDGSKLYTYLAYAKDKILKIPRECTYIYGSFNANLYLEKIYIPKSVNSVYSSGILGGCYNVNLYFEKDSPFKDNTSMLEQFNSSFNISYFDQEFDY